METIEKIIRLPDVRAMTGLCRTSIYNMMKNNIFPKQFKITSRSVGWKESEVQQWIKNVTTTKEKVNVK